MWIPKWVDQTFNNAPPTLALIRLETRSLERVDARLHSLDAVQVIEAGVVSGFQEILNKRIIKLVGANRGIEGTPQSILTNGSD